MRSGLAVEGAGEPPMGRPPALGAPPEERGTRSVEGGGECPMHRLAELPRWRGRTARPPAGRILAVTRSAR
ncbi:hypothetical protein AB0M29_31965 [Streptomyces sp. NPDC051976]|uniref:hypothetical protein n=1 Tax=Streptomyces sp. NPDC051976 TaxID=3154947 RepID=UPI0034332A29